MDGFWQTTLSGLVLLSVGGIAFVAWNAPDLYLRVARTGMTCLAVLAFMVGASGFQFISGYDHAVALLKSDYPDIVAPAYSGTGIMIATGLIFLVSGYVLLMMFVARSRAHAAADGDKER